MGRRYPLPEGARLRVLTVSADVLVVGEERDDIDVEPEDRRLGAADDERYVELKSKSTDLRVRVPLGTNVSVGTVSGDVKLEGRLGIVKVSTVSGRISIERTDGDTDVRSISGTIEVGECGGSCRANTKSGRIQIGHAAGAVKAHTMSGRIDVGTAGLNEVELKTISGSIDVRVDPGRAPRARMRSLSGRTHCDCPPGDDFEIRATTLSGSIEVTER